MPKKLTHYKKMNMSGLWGGKPCCAITVDFLKNPCEN